MKKATEQDDPLLDLGSEPVLCGVPDASEHHDVYLYHPKEEEIRRRIDELETGAVQTVPWSEVRKRLWKRR